MNVLEYFDNIQKSVQNNYDFANLARAKGLDPEKSVEVPQANSLAEKVVGLISAIYPEVKGKGIVERILSLEKQYGSLDPAVALTIAEEVALEKFYVFETKHLGIEIGVRLAIAYMTLGVVSSPIEGFTQLKLNKTKDGAEYFVPFYAGPIRSAGGTEAAFSIVIVDHLREIFGYARYDPTEDEVKRGVHEAYQYHERVTNLQYLPSEEELDFLLKNLPVQVSGDPSEDREVYNYKDLPRIETNFIRSGFCLTTCEGLAQKAPKILKRIIGLRAKGFKLSSWDWLADFVSLQKKIKEGKSSVKSSGGGATYMQDIVAGRPVFAHPGRSGAFRLRYGRCRNTGYSTLGFHPATMAISKNFIAVGTQLKIEKPTKGCTAASCDTISGPIVKLKDESVIYVSSFEQGKKLTPQVSEILYLGDILIPYGDFSNRNQLLGTPGYVEQYWLEEVLEKGGTSELNVSFEKAIQISKELGVSLHPNYIYYWTQIKYEDFIGLIDWFAYGSFENEELSLPYSSNDKLKFAIGKRALELIGCEHKVLNEKIILSSDNSKSLFFSLGIDSNFLDLEKKFKEISLKIIESETPLQILNKLCPYVIRDKAGTFIGARMGRPEKAKLRKLIGSPHVLFPVSEEGGRLRSVQSAVEKGSVQSDFPNFFCSICGLDSAYTRCLKCDSPCKKRNYCKTCNKYYDGVCLEHPDKSRNHSVRRIDMKQYFESAKKLIGARIDDLPVVIKGVRGTLNADHSCENLAKGLLRAKYNLHVNKDGTIRYDISEMPLTHFKPKEIGTSISKLKSLGYEYDIYNKELISPEQILEIFPHDVVLPACPETPDEKADDVLMNICNFIDDELNYLYKLPKLFNCKTKDDLAGVLLGCIAPHNCAAVVGRVIGFSKVQALLASPYMHAAMRRDCDGDEAAIMVLADMLINFSKHFLPSHRGGTQDAPLVLNTRIRAGEVDDMIFDLDTTSKIPLALYRAGEEHKSPSEVKLERVMNRLGGEHEFDNLWFSYDTSDLNEGPVCSSYKTLPTMHDKVKEQMDLCMKIRAVDVSDVARLTIERHFIRDIRGNLRKFSQQVFRCVACNEKFRRPPLVGKCTACGGKIIFTISEGSIMKYMQESLDLAHTYKVSPYLIENLEIVQKDIQSIFGKEKEKQEALNKFLIAN
ncbi:DNA polymerase II large subunit [Candidatus Pacearchaeota archaeon]|nr:DNA polymerase II large subunit [Candidatus Pacearchaeota archaeon]